MKHKIEIEWVDSGREPQCAPNPNYPEGIDVRLAAPGERSCKVSLPYPAKRCGYYVVTCFVCRIRACVTTAGRPDDPRSLAMACKATLQ